MAASTRKKRKPTLLYTTLRNLGWHVNIRHPETGQSHKHKFDLFRKSDEAEAEIIFAAWWAEHVAGQTPPPGPPRDGEKSKSPSSSTVLFVDAKIALTAWLQ